MLSIPIVFGVQGDGEVRAALDDLEKGIKSARTELVKLNNQQVLVEYKFNVNGEEVRREFRGIEAASKKVADARNKALGGEAGSISRQKKYIAQLKKERDELRQNTKEHRRRSNAIKKAQATLRQMQGIEEGSISRLKELRSDLIAQRDAVKMNSPAFERLTKQIEGFDKQLGKTKRSSITFIGVLGKFAVASAGIQAVAGALRAVGNAIDVYQKRTKEIEGFNLALENVGLSQAEVSRVFNQAAKTAKSLGAPLQQVEKTYKRMIPALKGIGASAEESDKFIEAVSARTQTLGLNTEQSSRLLEAFAQVLSKGKLQAEELNQQISELDGGFRIQLAQSLRVTTEELNNMISNSEVTADVFVKAVNRMQNGAELLKLRVQEGNLTIQQLQNNLSTLETQNIQNIGEAIEPAIRSFLKLRFAIAEFIEEFIKTEQFKNLAIVFNGVAKGVELFIKTVLNAIQAINEITKPFFQFANAVLGLGSEVGGLVGILTQLVLVLGAAKAAMLAFAAAKAVAGFVSGLAGSATTAAGGLTALAAGAAKIAGPAALAAAGIKLVTTAMDEGKKKGQVFTSKLTEVSDQLKAIGIAAPTAANSLEKAFKDAASDTGLTESAEIDQLMLQTKNLTTIVGQLDKRFKQLGVDIMDVNSITKLGADEIENFIAVQENLKGGIDGRIKQLRTMIDVMEKDGQGNTLLAFRYKEQLEILEQTTAEREVYIKQLKRGAKAAQKEAEATGEQAKKLEDLAKATQEAIAAIDANEIDQSTEALRRFGQSAKTAGQLAAATIGIEAGAVQARLQAYQKELSALQQNRRIKGSLDKEEQARYIELTGIIAQESQKQAQLGIDARNAIIDAFENGIRSAEQKVDVLADAAGKLKSSFDGVTGSLVSGLQAASGLIDEIVSRELKGLEVGSAKRKAIIEAQLKAKATEIEIEDKIARMRLDVQNKIATSQARIDQLRLQAQAQIAQEEGKGGLAAAYREAASLQGEVIKGLEVQKKIELSVLNFTKQTKQQKLISKGIDEELARNADDVAKKLGVQKVTLGQATQQFVKLKGQAQGYAESLGEAAKKVQDSAENVQLTALQQGEDSARAVETTMAQTKQHAADLNAQISAAQSPFENVEGSTSRIADNLKDAVSDAAKLSGIVAGGGNARALGGPVTGGQQYTVNDGGGREGFLSNSGKFSMLPAARNIQWTAPTSGTVIPANMVGDFLSAQSSEKINKASASGSPRAIRSTFDSGNLIKQMSAAIGESGGTQRITNNVTIQSQQPVTDASQIMTNVARMRLRNARRI